MGCGADQRGGPAPPAAGEHGRGAAGAWEALTWLSRREGFAVEREHPGRGDGVTIWAARSIRVRPWLGSAEALAAVAHELGHVLLHRPVADAPGDSTAGCRGLREADSAAFVVCARLGVNAGWLFPYVASWAGSDPRAQPEMAVLAAGERMSGDTHLGPVGWL